MNLRRYVPTFDSRKSREEFTKTMFSSVLIMTGYYFLYRVSPELAIGALFMAVGILSQRM